MRSLNAVVICCALGLGCGSSARMDGGGAGSGGEAGPLADGSGDGTCVQVAVAIVPPPPPDILIVMDRSVSMNDDINGQSCAGGCGAGSKWSLLSAAIQNLVMTTETRVNWGLKLFGDDGACGVTDGAAVKIGPSNASAIQAALTMEPGGDAPMTAAMNSAVAYLQGVSDSNPKYLMLATGGQPNCMSGGDAGTDDSAGAEAAVARAAAAGLKTFVVGVAASSDAVATTTLNGLAMNGGEALIGRPTSYYTLSDLAVPLTDAVGKRVSDLQECAFSVSDRADAGTVSISVTTSNGTVDVPEDANNGWSYDATMQNILLNGSACTALLDGTDTSVIFSYACGA